MDNLLLETGIWMGALIVDVLFTLVLIKRSRMVLCTKQNCTATLLLLNLLIFIACHVLFQMNLSVGSGVGLFAVLAMVRFRSEKLPLEQMILILFILSMGFIHAAFPFVLNPVELILIDLLLVGVAEFIRKNGNNSRRFNITVDNLELIKPQNRSDIIRFIESQTGYEVGKITVRHIDITKGKAELTVVLKLRGVAKKHKPASVPTWIRKHVAGIF